jgi:biotin carboxylase
MRGKTLHLVGGGFNQLPMINLAKSLGLKVLVTDMYENPPCRSLADYFEQISTTDKENSLQAAKRYQIDAVVTDQTDVAVPTVAFIARALHVKGIGYETALRFTNKYLMREHLHKIMPDAIPEFKLFNTPAEALEFCESRISALEEYLVKPINSQGSKGVYRLDHSSYTQHISRAFLESRSRGVLIERFIKGFEYSVEAYVQDQRIYPLALTKKYHYDSNDCIDIRNTYLGDVSQELENKLFALNAGVIEALGLPFGVTHAEYKVSNGKPYLMEIAARGGGGSISSKIVPYLTGFEPNRALLHHLYDEPFSIQIQDYKRRYVVMKFFDFKPGRLKRIVIPSGLTDDLLFFRLDVKAGDVVKKVLDSRDRPGYFVAASDNRDDVLKKEARVEASIQLEYES